MRELWGPDYRCFVVFLLFFFSKTKIKNFLFSDYFCFSFFVVVIFSLMRSRRSLPIVSVNSFLFPSPVAVCVCVCVCVNDVNDLWLWCIISFFFLSLSDFFERRHLRVVFFSFPFFFFLSFSFHHGGPNGRCRATHRLLPSYHC